MSTSFEIVTRGDCYQNILLGFIDSCCEWNDKKEGWLVMNGPGEWYNKGPVVSRDLTDFAHVTVTHYSRGGVV